MLVFAACGGEPPYDGSCGSSLDCLGDDTCLDGRCVPISSLFPDGGRDAGHDAGNDAGNDAGDPMLAFCPAEPLVLGDAAMTIMREAFGRDYQPPAPTGTYCTDTIGHPMQPWIEDFVARRLYYGCTGDQLTCCPDQIVTRALLATLVLRGAEGWDYPQPAGTGTVFVDVPASHPRVGWIEELARRGATAGCRSDATGTYYCPDEPANRAQVSVFVASLAGISATVEGRGAFCDDDGQSYEPLIEGLYREGIVEPCAAACE